MVSPAAWILWSTTPRCTKCWSDVALYTITSSKYALQRSHTPQALDPLTAEMWLVPPAGQKASLQTQTVQKGSHRCDLAEGYLLVPFTYVQCVNDLGRRSSSSSVQDIGWLSKSKINAKMHSPILLWPQHNWALKCAEYWLHVTSDTRLIEIQQETDKDIQLSVQKM